MTRNFQDLTEREILALAVSLEEEDARIYGEFANGLRETYPATAQMLTEMQQEEQGHRASLMELYRSRFGDDHIPLIRRQDVNGFVSRPAVWLVRPLGPNAVRKAVDSMEKETGRFYQFALEKTTDPSTKKLLTALAEAETRHTEAADHFEQKHLTPEVRTGEKEAARRVFVLQVVQPGLAGLMDGSVSTLAPLFAAAFATHRTRDAFLVGLAASVGAGISMAFAEGLSDDGSLTGRGRPLGRGAVTGTMTFLGGIGHTLPYLISDFRIATGVAFVVVMIELAAISWVRQHYMETPLVRAALQVILGGVLVFVAGILIGNS
jgi:rubrerythrin